MLSSILPIFAQVAGRHSLESEDPLWSQLFSTIDIVTFQGDDPEFLESCEKLVANTGCTQNLQLLLEQTASRVGQLMSLRHAPSKAASSQCCGAIHLTAVVMNYVISHLKPSEVICQISI